MGESDAGARIEATSLKRGDIARESREWDANEGKNGEGKEI